MPHMSNTFEDCQHQFRSCALAIVEANNIRVQVLRIIVFTLSRLTLTFNIYNVYNTDL